MSTKTLERLVWVLIYAGLLAACLGFFVRAHDEALGWLLIGGGSAAAAAGAVGIVVRSRIRP